MTSLQERLTEFKKSFESKAYALQRAARGHRNDASSSSRLARATINSTGQMREENAMQTFQSDYFTAYNNVKLTRDANGVLTVELHTNGGPCVMTAQTHTEFVEAFYRISQDRANKIVILTGAGGDLSLTSIGHLGATPVIPTFGARFKTKAFRY